MGEESEGIKLFGAMITLNSEEVRKGEKGREYERVEKVIIACPRCKSMETKFCYFNNYNVNQPRHFCKSCKRYWTAGGAIRNVSVGAGRRKAKSPCHGADVFSDARVYETSHHHHKFQIQHVSKPHTHFRPRSPQLSIKVNKIIYGTTEDGIIYGHEKTTKTTNQSVCLEN